VLIFFILRWNCVDARQPAIKIDIGAAPGTERLERRADRFAADRAGPRSARLALDFVHQTHFPVSDIGARRVTPHSASQSESDSPPPPKAPSLYKAASRQYCCTSRRSSR